MKKKIIIVIITIVSVISLASFSLNSNLASKENIKKLRKIYSSGNYALWPAANIDANTKNFKDIGLLDSMPYLDDNLPNDAKKDLGKILFFDPRLSVSGQIACASCHDPQLGWGDGKRFAFGHDRQLGTRNAMSLWNVGFYKTLFWDGRAKSLEDQAQGPIQDHLEMNMPLDGMEAKVKSFAGYKPMFKKAFGSDEIDKDKILKAIANFERTIVSGPSRFDQFIKGNADALKDEEVLGLHLFRTKARCVNCHNGGLFSDNQFHNDGQTLWGSENEDLGLYNISKKIEDVGKFKTPSLRETGLTGPWMHHGNFPSLKDVVQFYNLGNPAPIQKKYLGTARDSLLPKTSPVLQKLEMTDAEVDALIAFLNSITNIPRRLAPPTKFPK